MSKVISKLGCRQSFLSQALSWTHSNAIYGHRRPCSHIVGRTTDRKMLTKQEAVQFVEDIIGVSEPESKMAANKLDFLNLLIITMQHNFPFQNVSLLAEQPENRHRPSWLEIKEAMFQKVGGLCYTQNVFMYCLLQTLGYDVALNSCTVTSSVTYPNNHVVIIVSNVLRPNDQYIIDVAIGHPTFQAVSLDFEFESSIYNNSYLEYKYIKHEGRIMRMHGEGDFRRAKELPFDFYIGKFRRFYEVELYPVAQISDFDKYFDDVYTNPEASPFHKSLRSLLFRNNRAIIIVNSRLMIENENGKFDITDLTNENKILEAFKAHFPTIPTQLVESAVKNWMKIK